MVHNMSKTSFRSKKQRPQSAMDRVKTFRKQNYLNKIPKLSNQKKMLPSWEHKKTVKYNDGDKKDVYLIANTVLQAG